MWGWQLVVRRRSVSSHVLVPIKENGAYREEEHEGCANGNDQVHPDIPAISLPRHSSLYLVERAESLQGMRFCRKASQAAWARLRAPSLICAFFR